jgi:hypothetical protein
MEVEGALMRLREATAEINRATNDTQMKAILEKTWLLQDRLVFPKQVCLYKTYHQIRSVNSGFSKLMLLQRTASGLLDMCAFAELYTCAGRQNKGFTASILYASSILTCSALHR